MSFLLDTNVVSELVQRRPEPSVELWLANADEDGLFVSAITVMEMRYGIQRMPHGPRRKFLDQWLEADFPTRFEGRIVTVDLQLADFAGRLIAERACAGRPMEVADALIAATALVHDLTVVTRNTKDFVRSVPSVFNPWTGKTS